MKAPKSNTSAWIILKGHELKAKVKAVYSKSGSVYVEVWEMEKGITHESKAGGYGYDKFTAALAGATIDGHKIYNHCGRSEESEKILSDYTNGKISEKTAVLRAKKIGAKFANYGGGMYRSLHHESGLEILRNFGYTVITAC